MLAGTTILLAIVTVAVVAWVFLTSDDTPGDTSVDAGFARDMSDHHAQAVLMSGIVHRRTENTDVQFLAYDILTTQQAQIGLMGGWIAVWGLPAGSLEPPMAWMGHGGGQMPGMATEDEIASLETLDPPEMDRLFLQLMIRHHQAGIDMASYAAENASDSLVRTVARSMAEGQSFEIVNMEQMLVDSGE